MYLHDDGTGNAQAPTEQESYNLHAAYLQHQLQQMNAQYYRDPNSVSPVQLAILANAANQNSGWAGQQTNRPAMLETTGGLQHEASAVGEPLSDGTKAWIQMAGSAKGPKQLVEGEFRLDHMADYLQQQARQQQAYDASHSARSRDPYSGWLNSNNGMPNNFNSNTGRLDDINNQLPSGMQARPQQPQIGAPTLPQPRSLAPVPLPQPPQQQGRVAWMPSDAFQTQSPLHANMINLAYQYGMTRPDQGSDYSGGSTMGGGYSDYA